MQSVTRSIKGARCDERALARTNRDANTALVSMMKVVVEDNVKERSDFAIFSCRDRVNLYISAFGLSAMFQPFQTCL